ncbi:PDR/VanB family oxidoreductase [Cobetia sp. SIMBA_158]|uniref:PDR/VanB family oxidoreductase n=1 Tax=Cobetia sp. SIMBA_158 TaxID=3081617 RepID=UPI000D1B8A1D|nr:oxidoreductase [Halomonas sp. SF2003]
MSRFMKARVAAVDQLSSSVRRLTLVPADEASPFRPFSPGSHVVLGIPGEGRVCRNAYSLISPPDDPSHYCIAVRRQPVSRGGSEAIHSRVQVGDELELSPPANLFLPHWQARHHLMLAGGIGITPFLSYLPELERRGASWELHLRSQDLDVARFPEAAPYLASGNITQHRLERPNLKALLARQPAGTHVYLCGPQAMIDAVKEAARELHWSLARIHHEVFAAPEPGTPFTAVARTSGVEVSVGAQESMLEALERSGVEVTSLCRGGVCGQCRVEMLEGEAEHRDAFLDEQERASQRCVMPCVSRARSQRLVLDL